MRPRSRSQSMKVKLTNSLSIMPASSIGSITGALMEAQHRRELTTKASLDELKELSINNNSNNHNEKKKIIIKRKSIISEKQDPDFLYVLLLNNLNI